MRNVSVSLNRDNQIAVQIGSESRSGESYYLGLQPNSENHEFRPATGTLQLVSEWIRLLTVLDDGKSVFLPFDFSDEFTRWLHVERTGRDVIFVFGWATVEGWAISPRDLSQFAESVPGFMPDEPLLLQTFYLPRVLSELRHCREMLAVQAISEQFHPGAEGRLLA